MFIVNPLKKSRLVQCSSRLPIPFSVYGGQVRRSCESEWAEFSDRIAPGSPCGRSIISSVIGSCPIGRIVARTPYALDVFQSQRPVPDNRPSWSGKCVCSTSRSQFGRLMGCLAHSHANTPMQAVLSVCESTTGARCCYQAMSMRSSHAASSGGDFHCRRATLSADRWSPRIRGFAWIGVAEDRR